MPDIPNADDVRVNFFVLIADSVLYGLVLLLFVSDVYFLATRRTLAGNTRSRKHHLMSLVFLGVTALFILITAHWTVIVYRGYLAFIQLGNVTSEISFYSNDTSQPTEVASVSLFFLIILLGDMLLDYRLWIIWGGHRKVMILPVLTVVGAVVASVGVVFHFAGWVSQSNTWSGLGFGFSLINNIYSTGFIAFRMSTAKCSPESRLTSFLTILIESAALQTFWLTFTGIAVLLGSLLEPFAADIFPAIIGIANLLIHARVGLGWSQDTAARVTVKQKVTREIEIKEDLGCVSVELN
ncbi:hypothetical protein FB45DRAFT_72337 [Roridomyces roridus]|uniref:Uncharacterized protein n=1 Tax=Roridomyces roridus TaxID=1738132 RepID=A0AAD7FKW5_9AGAR|nr:hypothetical protein FB45DRAFT_72337 [Roridomyces roridus]